MPRESVEQLNHWPIFSFQMFQKNLADVQEELPGGKLNLRSMRRLEIVLGVSRSRLQFVAGHAGSFYRPFPKRERRRPFLWKFKLPKKKLRMIDNPEGELKTFQSKINEMLLKPMVFPRYLCGGVPGKTVLENVLMHLGAPVLVSVDIKNFFPRITNQQIYDVWKEILGCSPEIAALLTQLTTFERHLPQGAPTSSLLANLVMFSVDEAIREECSKRAVTYSTWVDDLAFSGKDARDIIPVVISSLHRAGFAVSHKKLKVMGRGTRKVLNGVLMSRFPNVLPERTARLRSGIHKLRTRQVAAQEIDKYIQRLHGGIVYVNSIAPRKGAKLRRELTEVIATCLG